MKEKNDSKYTLTGAQSCTEASAQRWQLNSRSRILIMENTRSLNNSLLDQTVRLLISEIAGLELPGVSSLPVLGGAVSEAGEGDLAIELADLAEAGPTERFTAEIGGYVKLSASSERAVMYGVRLLMQRAVQEKGIPYGEIADYPAVQERALHIDIGRKFFTCEWIKERIREMSYLRLNTLQLHFSENEGFTFESVRHPEVMSGQYLSRKEIAEIIEEAGKYHVTIIPSLDSPGHLGYALREHPEWLLRDTGGNIAKGALDITNPEARAFVTGLIGEYAEWFAGSPFFHIGGDEFIDFEKFGDYPQLSAYARDVLGIAEGTGIDTYIDYINVIAGLLEKRGFIVRAWNDGLYRGNQIQRVDLKSSIQITYWTKWHPQMAKVQTILDKGHEVINYNDTYFYYVLGENAGYKYPTGSKIYDVWHPGLFARINEQEKQEYVQPYPEQLIGCSFAVWSDTPSAQTEEEVRSGIEEPLLAMAELSWFGGKRYGDFEELKTASIRG